MAVLDGCESKFKTPQPEDMTCPKCGKTVEVFTLNGRISEDVKCDCGYIFEHQQPDSPKVERKS